MKQGIIYMVFITATCGFAQGPDTLWTKTFGGTSLDFGRCAIQTLDGGYALTGITVSWGAGSDDVYLIKTDAQGNTMWIQTYGGSGEDFGYSVVQTSDLGYIIAGYTGSFGVGGDVYLIKTDSLGDTLWTRTYGDNDHDHGFSVIAHPDGGYAITGGSYGQGGTNVYLIKTDSAGTALWTKTYGGPDLDQGRSVTLSDDGCYVITGTTYSFGAGLYDVYLIKTDSLGDTLWTRTYGGMYDEHGYSVITLPDGGYAIGGVTSSYGSGYDDAYLIRTNSAGDTLWTKTYGGAGYDNAYSVALSSDMGYVLTGWTMSFGAGEDDVYIVKTDSLGNLLWTQTYGGGEHDYGYSIANTTDDEYLIIGSTASFGAGAYDVWLLRTEPDVGINDNKSAVVTDHEIKTTIFSGPLRLPKDGKYKIFDITGRVVMPNKIKPGIYFIEVDEHIVQKIIKVN
jgi:hypothetical protein